MKIRKIRTGGQTGVDRAAMDMAREYGVPLCGWCPKNGWAEDYPDPPGLLKDYPEFQETPSQGTGQRTQWNMRDADAILTIIPKGSLPSPGTDVGISAGELFGKPMLTVSGTEDIPRILAWLEDLPDGIELCIGGPRASECCGAYDTAREVLSAVLKKIIERPGKASWMSKEIVKSLAEVVFAKTNNVKITSEVVSWASFHEERAEKMLRYLDTAEEITLSDIRYKMASIVYRESLLLRGNGSGGP